MPTPQISTLWHKAWTAYTKSKSGSQNDNDAPINSLPIDVSQRNPETITATNAISSPFLRLAPELRNLIYNYLDLDEQIIEVLSLSKDEIVPLDRSGAPMKHNPYPQYSLWFRVEEPPDQIFSLDTVGDRTPKRRYATIPALFPISRVCRQIREETKWQIVSQPVFAFSRIDKNYKRAFPAFIATLSPRDKSLIRAIRWPFSQAVEYLLLLRGAQEGNRTFEREFARLPGLEKVLLQYRATDTGNMRVTDEDKRELLRLRTELDDWDYVKEAKWKRDIVGRAMEGQIGKEGVVVQSVKASNYM